MPCLYHGGQSDGQAVVCGGQALTAVRSSCDWPPSTAIRSVLPCCTSCLWQTNASLITMRCLAARYIDPKLVQCWATVCDGGPTLNQHWINVGVLILSGSHLTPAICHLPNYLIQADVTSVIYAWYDPRNPHCIMLAVDYVMTNMTCIIWAER